MRFARSLTEANFARPSTVSALRLFFGGAITCGVTVARSGAHVHTVPCESLRSAATAVVRATSVGQQQLTLTVGGSRCGLSCGTDFRGGATQCARLTTRDRRTQPPE